MRRVLVTLTTLFLLAPLGQVRGMEPTVVVGEPVPVSVEALLDESACSAVTLITPLRGDEYQPGEISLEWESVGAECLEELGLEEEIYLVELFKIKGEEESEYARFKVDGTQQAYEILEPGKYRWVVSLLAGEPMFPSDPEEVPVFYVLDESVQIPTLISPIDGVWLPEGASTLTWDYENPAGVISGSRADMCTWNVRYAEENDEAWMLVEGLTDSELELVLTGGIYGWEAQCETYWARGNWSETALFGVDGTGPVVTIAGTTPLSVAVGATLNFSGTAADEESGVDTLRFRIVQGDTEVLTWTAAASPEAFAGSAILPAGTYQLEVEATDAVGNMTTETREIRVVVPTPTPETGGIGGDPNGTTVVVALVEAPSEPVQVAVSVPAPSSTPETVASPTPSPTPDQGDVAGATTDEGNTGSTTFWWWLLLTAVAIFIIWFLVGRRRDEEQQQN